MSKVFYVEVVQKCTLGYLVSADSEAEAIKKAEDGSNYIDFDGVLNVSDNYTKEAKIKEVK